LAAKRPGIKLLKITGIIFGALLVLLTVFHFWFKSHAKHIIENLVETTSNGKLKLKIGSFQFGYFSRKMEMKNAVFYSTADSPKTSYSFSVKQMKIEVQAILPIIFSKRILIDSLTLTDPDIIVTRLKASPNDTIRTKKDISIPEEMGKVYHSIQDALEVLKVTRFQIENGNFTLINKIQPDHQPLKISKINIQIDNIIVDTTTHGVKEKLFFSDNVILHCYNQDIMFPDSRHRLSFSKFRINLRKKIVEFDSCTIAATRSDNETTSFNVFADSLFLNNINFDTLYRNEVIKADSVYCVNPKFNLDVKLGRKRKNSKSPPILENIIKQLTGDLQLGYLIVSNADFNIKTEKNGNPSSFTFSRNNFEMQGLSIDQEASKPIKVKNFTMAIRNYENFIKDSSYSVKFDSILFRDDRIYLSNFLFNKLDNGRILNTFRVPRLYLSGLSWDDLVFEKRIQAEQATLFNPYINYTVSQNQKKLTGRQDIFQSLGAINNYMDLKYLDVEDGNINLNVKDHLVINLEKASFSVQSHDLLSSTQLAEIKSSLTNLNFEKGTIRAGDINIEMNGLHYIGQSGKFAADTIHVNDNKKYISFFLQNVDVEKMQVDERSGDIFADGIKWDEADIKLNITKSENSKPSPSIELSNVRGSNSIINLSNEERWVNTKINSISWDTFEKKAGSNFKITGLALDGKELQLKDYNLDISSAEYMFIDNKNSTFLQLNTKSDNGKTKTDISIPLITLIPHVNSLLNGELIFEDLIMPKPVFNIDISTNSSAKKNKSGLPEIKINNINITQPLIKFSNKIDNRTFSMNWSGNKKSSSFINLTDISNKKGETNLTVEGLNFYISDFDFTIPGTKAFYSRNGTVGAQIRKAAFEQQIDQPLTWNAIITDLKVNDFRFDSTGKSNGILALDKVELSGMNISSSTVTSIKNLIAANYAFQLNHINGHYINSEKSFWWYNGSFNRIKNSLSLDSFRFRQELSLESFLAKQKYQADYINVKTGTININSFDIDKYLNDSSIKIGIANFDKVFFTDHKDKSLPFHAGVIKPLPVNIIKKITNRLSIDSILLTNSGIIYTEENDKTKKPGTVSVTNIKANITNIKNHNYSNTDSLRILMTGYLMDSIWTRLSVSESYTDTAGGFLMVVQMKPADATVLNPVLIPLGSVKIINGNLDTLSMTAIGKEYQAIGKMKMLYHDLKIKILIDGDENKRKFSNSLLNFFANSFVIRNKNTSRTADVFFIRNRDRSAVNYIIKIALSGIASSVGIKDTGKSLRKNKKELRQSKLAPIHFD
jgi:hypothetical protein